MANDFAGLLQTHPAITLIAFNGKAAEKWFRKLALPELQNEDALRFVSLPSSSPAMASLSLAAKTDIWHQALLQPK